MNRDTQITNWKQTDPAAKELSIEGGLVVSFVETGHVTFMEVDT
jgi:hypothetical protein